MDIKNKRTILEDTASIYERRPERTEKQTWKELKGFSAKWEQFRSYYLLKVLILIGAIAIAIYAIYTFVKPRKDNVLFVAVLDDVISDEDQSALQKGFEKYLRIDEETQETYFDSSMFVSQKADSNSRSKLTALAFAGELDVVIGRESIFKEMASSYFLPLSEQLPSDLYSQMTDRFCTAVEFDDFGKEVQGSEKPYGLYITDLVECRYYDGEPLVIAICGNSGHTVNAEEFVRYILTGRK